MFWLRVIFREDNNVSDLFLEVCGTCILNRTVLFETEHNRKIINRKAQIKEAN